MKKLMATDAGWGLTILRVITGIVFIGHGLPKFGWTEGGRGLEATAEFLAGLGLPLPDLMAILVASAETFGGALLIIGFLVRPAAVTLVVAMLVATFMVHWDNGMFGQGGYQWSLLLTACSACILIAGAGKASVDQAIGGKA